jgi:hypothetical protein
MTVTPASLRAAFTEFTSTTDYPDSGIQFWIDMAVLLLNPTRWYDMLDNATMLFVAHNLSLELMAQREASNGNQPGVARGMLAGGSVDKVSYTYDTASVADATAGHWNLTIYGQRYIRLVKMFGAGPIQVGTPGCYVGPAAWTGPNYWN